MWAGPAQLAGPNSALKDVGPDSNQKGLGRSRPTTILPWSGPDQAQTAGLGQNHSGPSQIFLGQNSSGLEKKKA